MTNPLVLDIENSQSDRAAAYLLAGLLPGVGQQDRSDEIAGRLQALAQAEESGEREPLAGFSTDRVGMRWTVSSLCSVRDAELAQQIPSLFAQVMQDRPELMLVTAPGYSVFTVSGEYLPEEVQTIEELSMIRLQAQEQAQAVEQP